jgi:hypothetical protein
MRLCKHRRGGLVRGLAGAFVFSSTGVAAPSSARRRRARNPSWQIEKGHVISQTPKQGSRLIHGATVSLIVSEGKGS